jgi:uncharacterized protein (DUF2236 family)
MDNAAVMNDDEGYFPRGRSVLRMIHEERAVGLFYGQRALCIGALKPLNFVGTMEHTRNRLSPFKRLIRTARMFETVFLGTREQADRIFATVARMHERVVGSLERDAGHHPAGTPYSAQDPELMLWTLAVISDSAEWFYEHLVRTLTDAEREAFWHESLRFGALFGMPVNSAPRTYADYRAWYEAQLAGEELFLTEEARYMGRVSAFAIPMPSSHRLGKAVHDIIMLGSLPPRVRELYGLPWSRAHAGAFALALASSRMTRPFCPESMLRGSCMQEYELVARTEQRRLERGERTPQLAG